MGVGKFMISIFDVAIIIIWAGFVFYGLFFGLVRMIGNFVGLIVGVFLAGHTYLIVYNQIGGIFGGYDALGKIIVFLFLFGLFSKIVSFFVLLFVKIFNIIAMLPFLSAFNKLFGAVLGFVIGGLTLGLILYFSSKQLYIGSILGDQLASSRIAPSLILIAKILSPLFPEAVNAVNGMI